MPLCPTCKTDGPDGRYCANCGATRVAVTCTRCNTPLAAGARFCHNCGTSVAAPAPFIPPAEARPSSRVPWLIGGAAVVALLVLVITQLDSNTAPAANQPLDFGAAGGAARAPDISQMTPRERASRLFDRIMRLDEEGKQDSVQLFASMAIPTFQSLAPLDNHLRYDLGRVAAAAGELDIAQAQADSILRDQPQHLLGLILSAISAEKRGDAATAARLRARLVAAEASERARNLEEYQLHDADIRAAVSRAGSSR